MAASGSTFAKGELVYMWNQETQACDKEGVVNEVLEEVRPMGDGELPVGSVGVSSKDGLQTLWVRPEHAGVVLRKVDPPAPAPAKLGEGRVEDEGVQESVESASLAKSAPAFRAGDKVVAKVDFESQSRVLSQWLSSSLGTNKISKGTKGVVEDLAANGDLTVNFEGSWHRSIVPREKADCLELRASGTKKAQRGRETPSASSTSPAVAFAEGDRVQVWSPQDKVWEEDGVVVEVSSEARSGGDVDIPAGSVLVSFKGGARQRWISPKHVRKELRFAGADPAQPITTLGSTVSTTLGLGPKYEVGDFKKGDKVHLFHLARKVWEMDAVIAEVMTEPLKTDTIEIPAGTVIVSCCDGKESHTVMPQLFDSMLRREEHFGWGEVDPFSQTSTAPRTPGAIAKPDGDMSDTSVAEEEGVHQPPPSSSTARMLPSGDGTAGFNPPARRGDDAWHVRGASDADSSSVRVDSLAGGSANAPVDQDGEGAASQTGGTPTGASQARSAPQVHINVDSPSSAPSPGQLPAARAGGRDQPGRSPSAVAGLSASSSVPSFGAPGQPAVVDPPSPKRGRSPAAPPTRGVPSQPERDGDNDSIDGQSGPPPPSLFTFSAVSVDASANAGVGDDGADATTSQPPRALSPPPILVKPSPVSSLTVPTFGGSTASSASGALSPARAVSPAPGALRPTLEPPLTGAYDRAQQRVLIVGSGFGMELNPAQYQVVANAGFQIHVVKTLPNPESPQFPVHTFLPTLIRDIEAFQPHLVVAASKGGAYIAALWESGRWTGPCVIINRHPSLIGFPKGRTVVLCHGSNDEYYQYRREDIEALVRSGTPNRTLFYYTGNSGLLGRGYTREGDRHNMASLLSYDCLPRLFDAAMCGGDPEIHLMLSWNRFVTPERLAAEEWLGYNPHSLRRLWESKDQKGMDDNVLFTVDPGSEEYARVETCFRAQPTVPRAYHDMNPGMWVHLDIYKIERVENGMQEDGNAEPYFRSLARGIENQGLEFTPGLHTKWAWHGSSAVEEIVTNPISGFQPLMSGTRAAALWGPGTYFARDAKYVYDGGFCKILPDGSKQMLLCLLMTGIPCLGDPNHPGVLPVRHGRHRYNSSVDCLSNPEIYVTQNPGAAYPAYVITFA